MGRSKRKGGAPSVTANRAAASNQSTVYAIKDLERQVNHSLTVLGDKLNKLEMDMGNAYDLIEGLTGLLKYQAPSQKKMAEFCQTALEASYTDLDSEMKVNALVQYLEKTFTFSEPIYTQMIHAAFDKRNGLYNLPEGVSPQENDIAFIVWRFTDGSGQNIGAEKATAYRIGSNDLMVDQYILQMKRGDSKEFEMNYAEDHRFKALAGKKGVLSVGVLGFKRRKSESSIERGSSSQPLTQDQKKKVWKENYPAQSIT